MASWFKIPKFVRPPGYRVNVDLGYLGETIARYVEDGLDMDPDFQRPHVWDEARQVAFVEYLLRGGYSGREIYFNCPRWSEGHRDGFVLVDGKQRLNAVLRFLRGEIPAFGAFRGEYEARIPPVADLFFNVHDLPSRADVLRWYLDLNTGGVVHTDEELEKVRRMLEAEKAGKGK